jgi:hypothetical protein
MLAMIKLGAVIIPATTVATLNAETAIVVSEAIGPLREFGECELVLDQPKLAALSPAQRALRSAVCR